MHNSFGIRTLNLKADVLAALPDLVLITELIFSEKLIDTTVISSYGAERVQRSVYEDVHITSFYLFFLGIKRFEKIKTF